jgi:hypothetical protein
MRTCTRLTYVWVPELSTYSYQLGTSLNPALYVPSSFSESRSINRIMPDGLIFVLWSSSIPSDRLRYPGYGRASARTTRSPSSREAHTYLQTKTPQTSSTRPHGSGPPIVADHSSTAAQSDSRNRIQREFRQTHIRLRRTYCFSGYACVSQSRSKRSWHDAQCLHVLPHKIRRVFLLVHPPEFTCLPLTT